jgi:PAS domain S-box-containing protein
LIEAAPDAIFVHSEGRFTYLNPAMVKLFGASHPSELIGTDAFARLAPEYHERVRERMRVQRETGKPVPLLDQEILRLDGTRVAVETTSVAIRFQDRDSHLVFVRDVTSRKTAEIEHERLTAAIEQSSEIILITDPAGAIQYVNPAFERATGYARQEALGKTPSFLKSGKQNEAFYKELWGTITSGKTWTGRFINKRKNGTLYTEEATISPVRDTSDRAMSYVAVKRDITEHLHMSAQLQQSQKMESVGRLAGGVAHDFNNMLSVILGCTELAQNDLPPDHPIFSDLQEIRKAAERSADLTKQLLGFARKQTVAPKVLDLNNAVEKMLTMLRRLIGEDIELAWRPGNGYTTITMDPSQIDQILANLAVNARDAIAGGGHIEIETGTAALDRAYCAEHAGALPGDYVTLTVRDTGCGMDTATLEHIFEPFFTTKRVGEGTGLGLSTVYGIVQQNHGLITVTSEPEQGTVFTIYLPKCQEKESLPPFAPPKNALSNSLGTVLLVEDEPAILKMAQRKLQNLGYRVLTAGAPGAALELAASYAGEISLLITDVIMPGMNGPTLAARLRALRPNIKCLFMSGYTANIVAGNGVLDEKTHFIQKPFSVKDLAVKAAAALAAA